MAELVATFAILGETERAYARLHHPRGQRIRMEEIAQQTWREGRIERERFFFDPASVVQASEASEAA